MNEDDVYLHQELEIAERFGKKASESANYGCGVYEGKDYLQVSTKIYGKGILTTTLSDGKMKDVWEDFD